MSAYFTEAEIVSTVVRLTPVRLQQFVEARFVVPVETPEGRVFRQLDLARLELLCDLSDAFDMNDDAMDMVLSLVDQLHGVRAELKAVMTALADEPEEVRDRVVRVVCHARTR